MNTIMRRIAFALSLGLALGLGACSNDSTGPNGSVVGVYNLTTVNGSALPVNVQGFIITSDRYTLNSDGTYTEIETFSNSSNYIEHGTYSSNGGAITFLADNTQIAAYAGSVSGTVLTISTQSSSQTYISVYQRQ